MHWRRISSVIATATTSASVTATVDS